MEDVSIGKAAGHSAGVSRPPPLMPRAASLAGAVVDEQPGAPPEDRSGAVKGRYASLTEAIRAPAPASAMRRTRG